ncbi:bromodomain protein [Sporothrix brasiliensis 5110]|uniref:Bromodomain protein n=1 Tax=Sporothrix brasiliensis 5110 TaxID=1398154 RepID=A0A0C2IJG7_9PEZI|nr:bromodomain protein [Sporothrix brasiliensis 5110]KIH89296.1 bromodomain protein [Sporothrix brasiliensis 5110]
MEKRKSTGADGGDVRASKRLKVVDKTTETAKSTTKTGLEFLDLIRKTSDKNGRRIAEYFETLPPRRGNDAYYKAIRMPISLQDVEAKLKDGHFKSLSELESYIKRMVLNVREFYPKGSQQVDDSERVRKATSNFMVKHNPAYKLNQGYTAVPTPIPDEDEDEDEDEGADGEGDEDADGEGDEDADGDDDAKGEDDEGAAEEEAGDNEEEDEDEDNVGTPARRKSSSAKSMRGTPLRVVRKTDRTVTPSLKQDHDFDGVPYKGLSFQEAQEKIVEEIIRRPDEEDPSYGYFEPFFNLPPRTLKDYFQVIKDPLSIKKLQKLVKGIRSRTDRSGVSEYKSWAAFEEKASLLWENAYYYNEDGSPIANMAKELEKMFRDELRQAKEVVQEPPQPKIKIKSAAVSTPASSKKITIHVANTRGSSADSPSGKPAASVSSDAQTGRAAATPSALDKTRGLSKASPSPATSAVAVNGAKRESSSRASPALSQRPNGAVANGSPALANGTPAGESTATNGVAAAPKPPSVPARPVYETSRFREANREPLLANLTIQTHAALNSGDRRFEIQLPPHPKLTQRSVTLNIPPGQWRQQLFVSLNPTLQSQQRTYKMFVISNGATLGPSPSPSPSPSTASQGPGSLPGATPRPDDNAKLYDVNLHPGVNVVQVQVIAGLAKGQKLPSGADAELEKVTIFANLMKY